MIIIPNGCHLKVLGFGLFQSRNSIADTEKNEKSEVRISSRLNTSAKDYQRIILLGIDWYV
jgi:hypothetical protein